jgi:hypothetical protein
MPAVLIDNAVRADIHKIGFAETMRKFKVKYLITQYERPYYKDYAPIFEPLNIKEPSGRNYNRAITIRNTIGIPDSGLSDELQLVEEIERKYKIKEKFVLADQVGRFRFYSFNN